jgi:hypothetical protein
MIPLTVEINTGDDDRSTNGPRSPNGGIATYASDGFLSFGYALRRKIDHHGVRRWGEELRTVATRLVGWVEADGTRASIETLIQVMPSMGRRRAAPS